MKKQSTIIITLGIFQVALILLTAFQAKSETYKGGHASTLNWDAKLKKETLDILEGKCNVCHRRKNPFMIFNLKNMEKRAPKIYKMVFIDQRMPKGDEFRLSNEESDKLEKWLYTQNIY